ncbi:MAG TPA: PIG-L family deacetylase [Anaerolineales bacterium]|nr:PIG-L family deacetylase [Anaerolineales bacterium]
MRLGIATAEVFVPDGASEPAALARTTHLGIGAHQDDLEIMAIHGILSCFHREDLWFTGVVVTDGGGSPREGAYREFSDEQMRSVRRREQKKAALVGEYGAQVFLDYPSAAVKDGGNAAIVEDLLQLLRAVKPRQVYTHNLADKHDTHVGVTLKLIEALRRLPKGDRPEKVYGCEVWRDLDWLSDSEKVALDVSPHENLQHTLLGLYDSQIAGGKRYDLASMGRRRANATYYASHSVDKATGMVFAMDLMPLIEDPGLSAWDFIRGRIDRFSNEIAERLQRLQGIAS